MKNYDQFLAKKLITAPAVGISDVPPLNPMLFPFQRDIVRWALRRGRAAIWADCGMGKTPMQLEFAQHVPGDVLILAPLAVSQQTIREAGKFGITASYARKPDDIAQRITVTNYEMLEHFDVSRFAGVVLDESSILKAYDGKTRTQIIDAFAKTPFKLAATATPAPNDYMEIGNHTEFLNVMSRTEMLATFFTHDGGDTSQWRLKGHAESEFWRWLASWAVMLRKPSDLGYSDAGFILPELEIRKCVVESGAEAQDGMLFEMPAATLQERIKARRSSVDVRVNHAFGIVIGSYRTKLEACHGSQNMPSDGKPDTNRTKPNASAGKPNAEHQSETLNTCANTTQPTTPSGSDRQSNRPKSIGAGERDTPPTQCSESKQRQRQESAPQSNGASTCSGESTGSSRLNTKPSCRDKAECAQSVDQPPAEDFCTLITAIRQAELEGFFATHAISGSGISRTTQSGLIEPWCIWCNLNSEQEALAKAFGDLAYSVTGSLENDQKEAAILGWMAGHRPILISKPSIIGFGMNFQHCANMAFVGLSDSYEQFYQAVRRCWRFGQKSKVRVHVITAATEGAVVANIQRKEADAERMAENMVKHMASINESNIRGTERMRDEYRTNVTEGKGWTAYHGDCVDGVQAMPDNSIDFSVFSPPFASLYTYSNSTRDMGNSKDDEEFFEHFAFLVGELLRVTKPGRLLSFHCMDMPTSKARDGVIGVRDFRGELIRCFEAAGWVFHSSVVIWKDPVTAMQRTKALGLLHKTIRKDSAMSRQGLPDYLVTMRKPGINAEPIAHTATDFSVDEWQQLASPVWASANGEYTDGFLKLCGPYNGDRCGIDPTETLQREEARDSKDERHICPLQLEVIRRAIRLWTNPGDLVLSPFMGIGSEGYCAIQMGREFAGIELKASYYRVACDNLRRAEQSHRDLFTNCEEAA